MTSKVQMIVNGESYVLEYKLTNKEGFETSGAVRGAKVGQGFFRSLCSSRCGSNRN
jgi:uncharacterized protein YbjQ (UPF0145 family)